tara:strand:+ start:2739 stop:3068 length:330 start_codon:yes stop_codon:yes gene_type:complete
MNPRILSILNEYNKTPFNGPSFIIPNGVCVSNDTWRDSLEMRLEDLEFNSLYNFSSQDLQDFIIEKVELEGTDLQKDLLVEYYKSTNKLQDIWTEWYLCMCKCFKKYTK